MQGMVRHLKSTMKNVRRNPGNQTSSKFEQFELSRPAA
jgi:hypothetical protein